MDDSQRAYGDGELDALPRGILDLPNPLRVFVSRDPGWRIVKLESLF